MCAKHVSNVGVSVTSAVLGLGLIYRVSYLFMANAVLCTEYSVWGKESAGRLLLQELGRETCQGAHPASVFKSPPFYF